MLEGFRVAGVLLITGGFFTALFYTLSCLLDKKWGDMCMGFVVTILFVTVMCLT
jgi:hypothetical protein